MASAGLLRLLHSGLQDERLLPPKGQPKMEAFQKTFIKAGRFTTEWYRVDFDNQPAFGYNTKATIPRRGHLVTKAFLMVTMPNILSAQTAARLATTNAGKTFAGPTFGWTNSLGHALIGQAQVLIGATPIDTIDGRLMEVLDEFHTPLEKITTVNRMLGRHDNGFTAKSNGSSPAGPQELAIPLPFWFNRGDPSAALPIDAIGTDTVQISISINPITSLYTSTQRLPPASLQTLPPILSAPFYFLNNAGDSVPGLNGNPQLSQKVSIVPGITMPSSLLIGDTYLLLEYVYIDKPEANRIRLGDISYPIPQHYAIPPFYTKGLPSARIRMRIPNPARDLYFFAHRTDADLLNAPFLATRDLSGIYIHDASGVGPIAPWWPDASGLNTSTFLPLTPAYSSIDSEAIASFSLSYEGRLIRYATDQPTYFRSILQTLEQRKTPWHNKYYYHIPFGTNHEEFGVTNHMGQANLDKIQNIDLSLNFKPFRGSLRSTDVPQYTIYIWAETYNILRVYGGRAGLLFGY